MQKTRSLNRGGKTDLPLLKTLLAICQKSWEPSFWEVMDFFVLVPYASLAALRTLLQWLLACLNFTLDSEDLFCWYNWKKWFLWIMAAAQAVENHGENGHNKPWFIRGIWSWLYSNGGSNPLSANDVCIHHDSAPLGSGHFYRRNQQHIYIAHVLLAEPWKFIRGTKNVYICTDMHS